MRLENMYQEVILDHYQHPNAAGLRDPFDAEVHHFNTSCGDEVRLRVRLDRDEDDPHNPDKTIIKDISYEGEGCSISQASTSIMTEQLIGLSVTEAFKRVSRFEEMLQSRGEDEGDEELLGDGVALSGVAQYPMRVKCALMGWMAFKDAAVQAIGKG
ncbi:MAG: SUF system NifU family Fe-S cluster assembly protein [Lawsonella sp.]